MSNRVSISMVILGVPGSTPSLHQMNIRSTLLLVSFVACLFLPACGQRENVDSGVNIVRLFDIFEADDLAGNVSLATAGWERTAWQASEMASWQQSPAGNSERVP